MGTVAVPRSDRLGSWLGSLRIPLSGEVGLASTAVLVGCIVVGFVLRIVWSYAVPPETWGDTGRYNYIAAVWSTGFPPWRPAHPADLRSGVTYPAFLTVIYTLFGFSAKAVVAIQHSLGLLLIPLVFLLGRQVHSTASGLGAAALVAVDAALIRYEQRIYTEILFAVLLLLAAWCMVRAARASPIRWLFVAGLLVGAAVLARPSFQWYAVFAPLAFLVPLLARDRRWRSVPRPLAAWSGVFLVGVLLVVGPWVARNAVVYGYPGVSAISGQLIKRTLPYSDCVSGSYIEFRRMLCAGRIPTGVRSGLWSQGYDWLEMDRILGGLAIEELRKRPGKMLGQTPRIVATMWLTGDIRHEDAYRFRPEYALNQGSIEAARRSLPGLHVRIFDTLWPLCALLFVVGVVFVLVPYFRRRDHELTPAETAALYAAIVVLLPIVYTTVSTGLLSDTGNPRYRIAVDPLIFVFVAAAGAIAVARIGGLISSRRS